MKTRILHTKIWNDSFYMDLTPTEKLIFMYYITNDQVNIIHLYECSDKRVAFETGATIPQIQQAKDKFHNAGKILSYRGYIYLYNASKYEQYSGELNEKAKRQLISQLDDKVRDWYNNIATNGIPLLEEFNTPIDTPFKGTINHKSEIINHKSENILGDFEIFLQTFNELFSTSYKPTKTRRDKFKLRSETFSALDMLKALQNMARQPFYKGVNDRKWSADPDYFLRSDEIIDKHLNGKEDTPKKGVLDKYADRLN